mmetsp:Transcript_5558/g.8860  ORF Transcript_5558/g.8860 Transcript_5558/m.8860 type:complete len:107 (-) Transcript_5558:124-444(-)
MYRGTDRHAATRDGRPCQVTGRLSRGRSWFDIQLSSMPAMPGSSASAAASRQFASGSDPVPTPFNLKLEISAWTSTAFRLTGGNPSVECSRQERARERQKRHAASN